MKFGLILIPFLFSLAHADEKVEGPLTLLGRGARDRKTGESIALACITETCSQLRAVYFSADHKDAYFLGNTIDVSVDGAPPSPEQLKAKMKKIWKRFKRNRAHANEKRIVRVIQGGAVVAGLTILITAPTGPVPTLIALSGWAVGTYLLIGINHSVFSLKTAPASFDQTNGWNWTEKPKTISHRNFELLRQSLP